MFRDVNDVGDTDDSCQLNDDSQKEFAGSADMVEVQSTRDKDATSGAGDDLASKPAAAPLSSRASAFSIAALMKDSDTDTISKDTGGRHGSLYDGAAEQWQRQDSGELSGSAIVKAKTDAEYWTTFSNTSQRCM